MLQFRLFIQNMDIFNNNIQKKTLKDLRFEYKNQNFD